MKNKSPHYLLETDIIREHLTYRGEGYSPLIYLMTKGICFTTVINASELFLMVKRKKDIENVKSALSALHVIGIHSRYSLSVNSFQKYVKTTRDALIMVVAIQNKISIVTNNKKRFGGYSSIVFTPAEL